MKKIFPMFLLLLLALLFPLLFGAAAFAVDADLINGKRTFVPAGRPVIMTTELLDGQYFYYWAERAFLPGGKTGSSLGQVVLRYAEFNEWPIQMAAATGVVPDSTDSKKQVGVICKAYTQNNGVNVTFQDLASIAVDVGYNGDMSLPVKLRNIPLPHVFSDSHKWGSDGGVKERFLSAVNFDMHGEDWNGDGYTDYVLTYPTKQGNDIKFAVVFVDGKSLYTSFLSERHNVVTYVADNPPAFVTGTGESRDWPVQGYPSARSALGDIDGDGVKELITAGYFIRTPNNQIAPSVAAFKIERQPDGSIKINNIGGAQSIMSQYESLNGIASLNARVGVAALDTDNDGRDEITLLFITQCDGSDSRLFAASFWYDNIGGIKHNWTNQTNLPFSDLQYSNYTSQHNMSYPCIDAAAVDMDGDGAKDLVALYTGGDFRTGKGYVYLSVAKVNNAAKALTLMDSDTVVTYFLGDVGRFYYDFEDVRYRSSLVGGLIAPFGSSLSVANSVAVAYHSSDGSDQLSYRTYSLKDGKLNLRNSGMFSDKVYGIRPAIVLADVYGDGLALGEPVRMTIKDENKPSLVMQAPPRHFDIISGDEAYSVPPDENGNVVMDAFTELRGFRTTYTSQSDESGVEVTSSNFSSSIGAKSGNLTASVTDKDIGSVPNSLLGLLYKNSTTEAEKNVASDTRKVSIKIATDAENDDQIYYIGREYEMWRYPVVGPEELTTTEFASGGETVKGQRFMQYFIPKMISSNFLSTAARDVDWYALPYDNHNLFTYPRELTQIPGYPMKAASGLMSDSALGRELVRADVRWGNADATSAAFSITDQSARDYMKETTETAKLNDLVVKQIPVTTIISGVLKHGFGVNLKTDEAFNSAQTSKTDASKLTNISMIWPAAINYTSRGGKNAQDAAFAGQAAIYTQDGGVYGIGYSVSSLKNGRNTSMWGDDSPYYKQPDPGLLLPHRFYNGRRDASNKALKITAATFSKGVYGSMPTDTDVTIGFRIFNYSFVETLPFSVNIYYQDVPLGAGNKPDMSAGVPIARIDVPGIPGREQLLNTDNWRDVRFDWKSPQEEGRGFLHVAIDYGDNKQLSADNDRGYIEVGFYGADKVVDTASMRARMAVINPISARAAGETGEEMPDKDGDGWIDAYNGDDGEYLDEHDEEEEANHSYDARVTLDINKEGDVFVIHTVVRLPSEAVEPGQKGVPLATCTFYLDDNTVLGSKIIPYLLVDEDYEIEMKITQSDYPYKDVEELLANLEKEYSQSGQQTGETSGGSGGCSSAATSAALAMSLSAAVLIRRKTK